MHNSKMYLLRVHLRNILLFVFGIEVQCVRGEHVQGEVGWLVGEDMGLPAGGIRASQGTFYSISFSFLFFFFFFFFFFEGGGGGFPPFCRFMIFDSQIPSRMIPSYKLSDVTVNCSTASKVNCYKCSTATKLG